VISNQTVKDIAGLMVEAMGLREAKDLAARMKQVKGNKSFTDSIFMVHAELDRRLKLKVGLDVMDKEYECDGTNCPDRPHDHRPTV
jgi:uncharacterized membrane protein YgcG